MPFAATQAQIISGLSTASAAGVFPLVMDNAGDTPRLRSDLARLYPVSPRAAVVVDGAVTSGDGFYAVYIWSASSAAAPDGVTVIQVGSLPGRWLIAAVGGSISVGGITQITGDATAGPGSGSQALTLASVNGTVGTFGDGTHIPQITVNAKGLITTASIVPVAIGPMGGTWTEITAGSTVPVANLGMYLTDGTGAQVTYQLPLNPPDGFSFVLANGGTSSNGVPGSPALLVAGAGDFIELPNIPGNYSAAGATLSILFGTLSYKYSIASRRYARWV